MTPIRKTQNNSHEATPRLLTVACCRAARVYNNLKFRYVRTAGKLTTFANFPLGTNRRESTALDTLYARAADPRHRRSLGGQACGEALSLFCNAYGVASCWIENRPRRSRRQEIRLSDWAAKKVLLPKRAVRPITLGFLALRAPCSAAIQALAFTSLPEFQNAPRTATRAASAPRPHISSANYCAGRTANNGFLRSWTGQTSNGGAICNARNGSQRRSIASNEFQLVQKMHEFNSLCSPDCRHSIECWFYGCPFKTGSGP